MSGSNCPGLADIRDDDDAALLPCCTDCLRRTSGGDHPNQSRMTPPATLIGGQGWVCPERLPRVGV